MEALKKIVLTGPESTGKTTLAQQLAESFGTVWVPEFARNYLDLLRHPFEQCDLLEIAKGQIALETSSLPVANKVVFFDTSLEVVKIWSEVRFGECDPWILGQLHERRHDLYLLCRPDIAWQPDPHRENPHDRDALFELYRQELKLLEVNFVEVSASGKRRFKNAANAVNDFLKR